MRYVTMMTMAAGAMMVASGAHAQSTPMGSGPGMMPKAAPYSEPTPYVMTPEQKRAFVPMGSGPGGMPPVVNGPTPTPVELREEHRNAAIPLGSGPGLHPRMQTAQAPMAPAMEPAPAAAPTKRMRHARKGHHRTM